jgi:hypothetical protein
MQGAPLARAVRDRFKKPLQPLKARPVGLAGDLAQNRGKGSEADFARGRRQGSAIQHRPILLETAGAREQFGGRLFQRLTRAGQMICCICDARGRKTEGLQLRPVLADFHPRKAGIVIHRIFEPIEVRIFQDVAQRRARDIQQRTHQ